MSEDPKTGVLQRKEGDVVVLTPTGDVEPGIAPTLERIGRALLRENDLLLAINLEHADIVTSLGLSVLLRLDKATTKAGGRMVLFGLRAGVREILEKTRLDTVLQVCRSMEQALDALHAAP